MQSINYHQNTTVKCFECLVNTYLYWVVHHEIENQKLKNLPEFIKRLGKKEAIRLMKKFDDEFLNTLQQSGSIDLIHEIGGKNNVPPS